MSSGYFISLERRLYNGKKIVPSEDFQESLKAFLFTQIGEKNEGWFVDRVHHVLGNTDITAQQIRIRQRVEQRIARVRQERNMLHVFRFLRNPKLWIPLVSLAGLFLLVSVFAHFLLGQNASVSAGSVFQYTSGDVFIESASGEEEVFAGKKIASGQRIMTEQGKTGIVFFDDSFLYLDSDTILRIENHVPDPFFPDSGTIEVVLEQGRVWVRTFSDTPEISRLSLKGVDTTLTPDTAALDFTLIRSDNTFRIWERSAQFADHIRQQSRIFIAGEKGVFTSWQGTEAQAIVEKDQTASWLQGAMEADLSYRLERFESKIAEYERTTGVLPHSPFYFLKTLWQDHIIARGNAEETFRIFQLRFQEALLLATTERGVMAQEVFLEAIQNIQQFYRETPEAEPWIRHLFWRLQSDLSALPAENTALQDLQEILLAAEAEIFQENPAFVHKNLLETLWKLQRILLQNDALASRELFAQYVAQKQLFPNTVTKIPEYKKEILALKIQELRLLDFLYQKIFAEQSIRESEQKVVEEILALIEERKNVDSLLWNPEESEEENLLDILQRTLLNYETSEEQQRHVRVLLADVQSNIRSLPLLQAIRESVPSDLRSVATDRMVEIIEQQRRLIITEQD